MSVLATSVATLTAVTWSYLALAWGSFWRLKPLPAGWTGKLWAMHQGIERARELNPAWLMFADADVLHDAETVVNLSCIASRGHYDLVSFMVKLHCESLPEKLLIPAFVYFFFM